MSHILPPTQSCGVGDTADIWRAWLMQPMINSSLTHILISEIIKNCARQIKSVENRSGVDAESQKPVMLGADTLLVGFQC